MRLNTFSHFQDYKIDKIKPQKDQTKKPYIKSKIEVIDLNNFDRYRKLTQLEMARKAVLIFFANPIVAFLKILFQLTQMLFDTFDSFVLSWFRSAADLTQASNVVVFVIIIAKSYIVPKIELVRNLAQGTVFIARIIIYSIALQFASVFMMLERGNISKKYLLS